MPTPPGVNFSQRLIAACVAALATVLLMNVAGLMGVAGSMFYLFVAVPIAYVHMRFGSLSAVAAFALTAVVLFGMYGLSTALSEYVLLFGVPALILPFLMCRSWPWDRAAALTVIVSVVLAVGITALVAVSEGASVTSFVDQYVKTQMDLVQSALPDTPDLTAEQQRELRLLLQGMEDWFRQTYPAIIVSGYAAVSLLLVWALSLFAGRHYTVPGEAFVRWKAPENLVWGLIVAGFLFFVADGSIRQLGLNVLIVLLLVYYIQGLAIVTDLFERRQFPTFLRVMGYGMALILNPIPFIVAGVGVFDLWIDFRKKRIKGN